MQEKEVATAAVAPTKPKKRGAIGQYYDTNKEAILADYQSLRLLDFLHKWQISPATWLQLKKKWGVPNRGRDSRPLTAKSPGADNTQALTEHERYLILLGYQMAVLDFLKAE